VTVGSPIIVKPGLLIVYSAVSGSASVVTVLHASLVPAIGSNAEAMLGLPPAEVSSCGLADPKLTVWGCSFDHELATKGPPAGAPCGHVCVYAVTLPLRGTVPMRCRRAPKKAAACSWKAWSVFSLFDPRLWPRSPNCSAE